MFSCRALAATLMPAALDSWAAPRSVSLLEAEGCPADTCADASCEADTCADATCGTDTCLQETCFAATCEGSSCPSDTCDAGTCVDASFCEGQTCQGGPTCAGSTCPGGDSCEQATCGGGPSCSGDSCLGDSCPGDSCHDASEIGPCFAATEPCLNTQECADTNHCDHTFLIIEPPPDDHAGVGEVQDRGVGHDGMDLASLHALHEQLEELLRA